MPNKPQTVLVLGATGMLGHTLMQSLSRQFQVYGTARDLRRAQHLGVTGELLLWDAHSPRSIRDVIRLSRPQVIVNCVGLVKQLEIASQPIDAISVNALLPHILADECADSAARLIHISTDCVFSGELPYPERYTERHVPDAIDLYGRTKILGETSEEEGLTLRTSIIGRELDRKSGLLEWFLSQEGPRVDGFTEAWYSGLTTYELARVIGEIVREHHDLTGVYNVASDPISKFELLLLLRDAFGKRVSIVQRDEPKINRLLDGSRFLEATGIGVGSWNEMTRNCVTGD